MKRLRKLTGAAAVLTLVVMIAALFRFHGEEMSEPGQQQVVYDLDEGWNLVSLPASKDVPEMTPLVRDALSSGTFQTVDLPYRASGEMLVFQSTLSHDFSGMTLVSPPQGRLSASCWTGKSSLSTDWMRQRIRRLAAAITM